LILIFSLDLAADRLISDESWEFLTQGNFSEIRSGGFPTCLVVPPISPYLNLASFLILLKKNFLWPSVKLSFSTMGLILLMTLVAVIPAGNLL